MRVRGYTVGSQVHPVGDEEMYRACRDRDGSAVLVKVGACMRREHALRAGLVVAGVLPVVELVEDGGTFLVVEDRGGVPIAELGPLDLATQFRLAMRLVDVVGELRRRGIVHRGISPAHLLVHPITREVWLEGWRDAERGELCPAADVHALTVTLENVCGGPAPYLDFWGGLAMTAAYREAEPEDKLAFLPDLINARENLALAVEADESVRGCLLLLTAEMKRIEGYLVEAVDLYDAAIAAARRDRIKPLEALALELGGRA